MGPKKRRNWCSGKKQRYNKKRQVVPGPRDGQRSTRALGYDYQLRRAEDEYGYAEQIAHFFRQGLYCDLDVVCQDKAVVKCHRLVLAALSSNLAEVLRSRGQEGPEEEVLVLPDVTSEDLTKFLDVIYTFLETKEFAGLEQKSEEERKQVMQVVDLLRVDIHQREVRKNPKVEEEEALGDMVMDEGGIKEDSDLLTWNLEASDRTDRKRKLRSNEENVKVSAKKAKTANGIGRLQMKKIRSWDKDRLNRLQESVALLEAQIDKGAGSLKLEVEECPEVANVSHNFFNSQDCFFAAMLGVKKSDSDHLEAVPLAWSSDSALNDTDRYSQYSNYCQALQVALGFSESEIKHNSKLRVYVGLEKPARSFRRILVNYSEEQLQDLLKREDIVKVCQSTEKTPLLPNEESVKVSFSKDLDISDIEGIALLLQRSDGLYATFIQVGDKRKECAIALMATLFQIWSLRADQNAVGEQDPMYKDYIRVNSLAKKAKVAQEYLDKPQRQEGKTGQCPKCCQVFNLVTVLDREQFKLHKERHFYEDYQCDCEGKWDTYNAKRKHVLLHHTNKKKIKCTECEYVCGPKGMAGHVQRSHEKMHCEHCSAILTGSISLEVHKETFHPEHSKKGGDKIWPGSGRCDICGEHFRVLKRHIEIVHKKSQTCECDICGKTFTRACGLQRHRLRIHFPEQMKVQCELCDER